MALGISGLRFHWKGDMADDTGSRPLERGGARGRKPPADRAGKGRKTPSRTEGDLKPTPAGSGRQPPAVPRRPTSDRRSGRRPQERAGEDDARTLRQVQPPPDADPNMLDPEVRHALRSLAPATADRVAAHLVAVGELLDSDPEAALLQARAARAFASRIGVVREAVGLAAYAAEQWQEALSELRAERRLTGSSVHLPVMADCERGLGRPERALELAQSPDLRMLDEAGRVEMLIVASGARRDMGQPAAAVVVLQSANLDRSKPRPWSGRLWYAYADALLAAGRRSEARDWFEAVTGVDEGETDAEERLMDLDGPPEQ